MSRSSKKSMDGKLSSMRRVATRMTAPSAPSTRSSHRKENRSWPGVPNRYSRRSASRLMRPKSRATVVVVLPSTPVVSSMPIDRSVMSASVTRGSISEMAPTKVVLPTPKPPLITIFTAMGGEGWLERPNTVPDPLDDVDRDVDVLVARHVALRGEVPDEDLRHPDRYAERGGDLGDRLR